LSLSAVTGRSAARTAASGRKIAYIPIDHGI
jgi:hypothetical protein